MSETARPVMVKHADADDQEAQLLFLTETGNGQTVPDEHTRIITQLAEEAKNARR